MLTTNLLPKEERDRVRFASLERVIIFLGISITSIFGIGIVLLLPSYLPLFRNLEELQHRLVIEKEASRELHVPETAEKIHRLRFILLLVKNSFEAPARASEILDFFFNTGVPVAISAVTATKDNTVAIQGKAPTRENLLEFEQKLRESGMFQDISVPLSQIVNEKNIAFNVQGTLKSAKGLIAK